MTDEELKERDEILDEAMEFFNSRSEMHGASLIMVWHMMKIKQIRKRVGVIFDKTDDISRSQLQTEIQDAIK